MIDFIGNEWIRTLIENEPLDLPLGRTWLFTGPRGVGKALFAKQWALKKLREHSRGSQIANHPDLHIIKPSGKQALHTMGQLRQMGEALHLPPTLSPFKIFIIEDAERLPLICSNYLLKTLEEPPRDTLFILTTHDPRHLPQTIHSRSRTFYFHPIALNDIEALLKSKGLDCSSLERSCGSLAKAERIVSESNEERRAELQKALSRLEELSLTEIIEVCDYLQRTVQHSAKSHREKLEVRLAEEKDRLSASQMELQRGAIEGEVTLLEQALIDELFEEILLYFRDAWAHFHGARPLCFSVEKGNESRPLSFVTVENLLIKAKELLIYGTPLALALQRFCLGSQLAYSKAILRGLNGNGSGR